MRVELGGKIQVNILHLFMMGVSCPRRVHLRRYWKAHSIRSLASCPLAATLASGKQKIRRVQGTELTLALMPLLTALRMDGTTHTPVGWSTVASPLLPAATPVLVSRKVLGLL